MPNLEFKFLTYEDITHINKRAILETGGDSIKCGIVINQNSLKYLVDSVKSEINGIDLFPSIYHKAAEYAHKIIADHIFIDGNKRTGLLSSFLFLYQNGYHLSPKINNDEIIILGNSIATNSLDFDDIVKWFQRYFS